MDEASTLQLEESTEPARKRRLAVCWLGDPAFARLSLERDLVCIGRGEEADFRVDSSGVSRRHAEIHRQGPTYALRDLGSTNGSYVNGARVHHAALSRGDVLRLGDAIGVVVEQIGDEVAAGSDPGDVTPGVAFGPGLASQLAELRSVSSSELPVVMVGETGTGKDCAARALHALSGRRGPFQALNCAAIPTGLAEAELFGYRKGAFTGADQAALGHLRAAEGGTLFLDELAELPPAIQAKLLRTLQDGSVVPLGETRGQKVRVRLVTACQQPFSALVGSGRLRADLAARLNGIEIVLPPLRERRIDIAFFAGYFFRKLSGGRPPALEPRATERLLLYSFPGNVRELALLVERLLVTHGHERVIKLGMLPEAIRRATAPSAADADGPLTLDRAEHDLRRLVLELDQHAGSVSRAAAAMGISRQRAYRLLKQRKAEGSQLGGDPEAAREEG